MCGRGLHHREPHGVKRCVFDIAKEVKEWYIRSRRVGSYYDEKEWKGRRVS